MEAVARGRNPARDGHSIRQTQSVGGGRQVIVGVACSERTGSMYTYTMTALLPKSTMGTRHIINKTNPAFCCCPCYGHTDGLRSTASSFGGSRYGDMFGIFK